MASESGLLLPNGEDQRAVQVQGLNRRAGHRGETNDVRAFPFEVLVPGITTWIIQPYFLTRLRVHDSEPRSFTK
jgi:hypothetical protein